ncbi:hypothetical protein NLG97_g7595 [Lecanicillium saksenae]|uniref:Uncharacterized protein n=1 Tax=Lecanicillium saksenae TaxID=468837 RepID=A0ACC1QML9_9HYPO|nr:hypothetical protein NLG97_g7595 [Lecanicillium saksenae]
MTRWLPLMLRRASHHPSCSSTSVGGNASSNRPVPEAVVHEAIALAVAETMEQGNALQQDVVSEQVAALLSRRDQWRCCISPPDCAQLRNPIPEYILSPKIEPLLNPGNQYPQARLLRAFVGPKRVSYLQGVFAALFDNDKLQYCDGSAIPTNKMSLARMNTESPTELHLPSPYLVQLQRTFARALEMFSVEEDCSKPWPEAQTKKFWNRSWLRFFRRLWHFIPQSLRIWTYKRMLPPDDTFQDEDGSKIVVMTQVPGVRAMTVFYRMTYQKRRQLADALGAVIGQIRKIPNHSGHRFTGISTDRYQGSKVQDSYVGHQACGPLESNDAWNMSMAGGNIEPWRIDYPKVFKSQYESKVTHSDLHLSNILVHAGQLSGIIDWEISGFYPEYWEFAKGMTADLNNHPSSFAPGAIYNPRVTIFVMYASPVFPSSPLCRASPDGSLVATLSAQTISVRSVETLQTEHAIQLPSDIGPVGSLLWSPSSTRLLVCAGENIHVFSASIDSSFHATISSPLLPGEKANIARFGARDSEVLICSPSGLKIAIFNLSTSTAVEVANPKFHQPSSVGRSYSVRSETEHLAILTRSTGKDFVSIHHPITRQVQKSWAVETVDAQAVSWTPDGKWLMLWESAAHGHHLVLYAADGQHFRTITGINLSENPDASLELGIKTCQPSHTSELCAIGDHSRDVVVLQTDSWRKKVKFSHPVTIVPQDTLQVWQEQLNTSRDGQTVHTFQRATQMISPPGMPSDGKPIETKPGCSTLAFDASSNLLATKLDDAPCTVWIWDIAAAELRSVLVFHSVVSFSWHRKTRELLLITSQDESRQGLSYLWDPLLQGPTPVVPEEFISVKNSVGAPIKAQISWINTDMEFPLALLSTAQQYRILSLGEGDQVPETWHGASKWDDQPPRRKGIDPDISEISIDDGAAVEDTFSFRNT